MSIALATRGRFFRFVALVVVITTGNAQTWFGLSAAVGAVASGVSRALRTELRQLHGHYTTVPGAPFLGERPGRDPQTRGGLWKSRIQATTALAGGRSKIALGYRTQQHTQAVAVAPGSALPWEGSAPAAGGTLNTGNGDLLTSLHLLGWKSRGMDIDFTLYQNSETNYSCELGAGWTWSYDIYVNPISGGAPTVHWGNGLCIPYTISGSSYVPPAGIYDQLVKNANGTWTVTQKDGTTYQFNTAGFCTSISDLDGNTITLTLNSGNYVTQITDPTGRSLTINVNGSGQFTSIVDPLGRTWSFTITGGELTKVAWPSLNGTVYNDQYTYSSASDILTHTDKRGNVWSYTYNSGGSIATATDPLNHTTTYGYTASATTITDP